VELHHLVRDLIRARGHEVLLDPSEFRAALDDFLTDDEISIGDANVLVDAVRLGSVQRLEALLAGGGAPRAAVAEAGTGLARDRGSDDSARSVRAVAVLGFALGWVDEAVVLDQPTTRDVPLPSPKVQADSVPPQLPPPQFPPPVGPPPEWLSSVSPVPSFAPPTLAPAGRGAPVGTIMAVVGVVLAVIIAGYLGWRFLWPRGGADSPEEAVELLFTAIADQDLVGIAKLVAPAEVADLKDVFGDAIDRLKDEELIDDEGLSDAAQVDFEGLEFDVDELGDHEARVTLVAGTYTASWVPERLPERLRSIAEDSDAESGSGDVIEDLFEGDGLRVTTVEDGGRWYVSLVATIADYVHRDAVDAAESEGYDLAEPDYDLVDDDLGDPITGEDPEDVVDELVAAVNSGDAEDVLAGLPDELVRPLRPYLPVVGSYQDEAGWGDDTGLSVGVGNLELATDDLDDGSVMVTIESATFTATGREDGSTSTAIATFDGDCLSIDEGYGPDTGCLSDSGYLDALGIDSYFFVVGEVDDGYQLDPTATLVAYATLAVENFRGNAVDDIIDELASDL